MGTTSSSSIFSGNSRYASDFQAVIDRSVAIASLPISQLNNDKTDLTEQADALTAINTKFTELQTAITGIQSAMGGASLESSISDTTKVSASLADGAQEGTYSIRILNAGTYATSMTGSWAPASDTSHNFQLSVGGNLYSIETGNTSASSIATAINNYYGDKVRATVVNVNTTDNPDYRVSLQAVQLGDVAPDIFDNGVSQKAQSVQGALATYVVNESGKQVDSSTRTVTIADGVTLTLLASGADTPVDITVSRSTSALSDAVSKFTDAYNAAIDELDKQHGTTPGALAGSAVVGDLSNVMRGLSTYTSGGSVGGLVNLGVELGDDGRLSYNPFSLMAQDIMNSAGIASFFGSAETGGFLKFATDALNGVERAGTGILTSAQSGIQSQISSIDSRVAEKNSQVDALKTRLQTQMAAADALIASMEQQYSYLSSMFQSMQTASQQYK